MLASACLTLAAVHVLVWWNNRSAWASLLFSQLALATAVTAGIEVWMMRAQTPAQFGIALRWDHVPIFFIVVAVVGFVRLYLRAGRPWLAWVVCGLRAFTLLLNFLLEPNLNFRVITGLRQIRFLGESIPIAEGVRSPWMLFGQASFLLFVIFVADATFSVWRRRERGARLVLGCCIVFFAVAGTAESALVLWGVVHWPFTAALLFMPIVAVMGYELSADLLRARQMSADLHAHEVQMSLAVDAVGVGVWMWNLERDETWASEKCARLYGFTPGAAVSHEMVMQRIHPEDRPVVERELRRAVADRRDYLAEYRVVLPEGQVRWLASRGRPECNDQGKAILVRGISLDTTLRKQAEREAQRQRDELAHVTRVSMLGELSGSLAHELNQPLGSILRNAEAAELFLQQPAPDLEELRAILADIRKDEQRAGAVIQRMRSLLKRHEIELGPVDLNQLVAEIIGFIHQDAESRKVSITFEPVAGLPGVRADRILLQQVLLNLVLNAMDAVQSSAEDARRVTVELQRAGRQVEVAVSDTGGGIPADLMAKIFEPFFTTKKTGMGMGLSISGSILEAHGSRLRAANLTAGGARFSFTLPIEGGLVG